MKLAIIDSGGANISSVKHALRRLGTEAVFTSDVETILSADKVILPGVGAAAAAMNKLNQLGLVNCIRDLKQPVLGICLGMQLLFESSSEGQQTEGQSAGQGDKPVACLGVMAGKLEKLTPSQGIRVPHMGWNTTRTVRQHDLLKGLPDQPWFYFVHSYRVPLAESTLASCLHGEEFAAIVSGGNFHGAQFHPERSADCGARFLANFLEMT